MGKSPNCNDADYRKHRIEYSSADKPLRKTPPPPASSSDVSSHESSCRQGNSAENI